MSNHQYTAHCLKHEPANPPINIIDIRDKYDSATKDDLILDTATSSIAVYSYLNEEINTLKKRVDRLEKQPNLCSVKIYDLASDIYNLKYPIDVVLKVFEDEILAIVPDLEIYGNGTNEIQALNDLKAELIDLFKYLNTIPASRLGRLPKRWKKNINSFIEK